MSTAPPVKEEPPKPAPIPSMYMLSEAMYHRPALGPITSLKHVADVTLTTTEEVYQVIRGKAGEEWEKLDCGWNEEVGMLYIHNHKTRRYTQPSPEEAQADNEAVLEITYNTDNLNHGWEIPQDMTFRGAPKSPKELYIRCRKGVTTYTLTAFPV